MANYDNKSNRRHTLQPSSSNQDCNGQTTTTKIGAGLSNLGNTCFLNSVLQCLTYTPPLVSYLESGQHKATCCATGFCSICALQDHVKQTLTSFGGLVSPAYLVKNLKSISLNSKFPMFELDYYLISSIINYHLKSWHSSIDLNIDFDQDISKSFRPWQQEDAHEYMRYLIESLDNCCSSQQTTSNSPSGDANIIHKIFGGQLRSQVKCTICSTCSNTYDPFLDLSLEINRADSLTKALNRFTAVEALEGDNEYYCANCKKKVYALKQFTIDKSPLVITIQFKRFNGTGGLGGKIDKKIDFGRTLAMRPYISNPQDCDANYSLYAVLVHAGWSTYSGHYYCFVRTTGGLWHNLDDSQVRQVSEATVLDQKAYILFYIQDLANQSTTGGEQLDTSSSSTLKNKWLSEGADNIENDMNGGVEEY